MAYKVIWSENASNDLKNIVDYLSETWSYKIANEFVVECMIKIELISVSPFLGALSEKRSFVRRILITKHNYLYYKLLENNLFLLNFVDTRQDPAKNPFN